MGEKKTWGVKGLVPLRRDSSAGSMHVTLSHQRAVAAGLGRAVRQLGVRQGQGRASKKLVAEAVYESPLTATWRCQPWRRPGMPPSAGAHLGGLVA